MAGRREGDPPTRALEERDPELLLQPADLVTQGGLGDVKPGGRATEMQLLRDRDEVVHQAQIDSFDRRNLPIGRQSVLDTAGGGGDDAAMTKLLAAGLVLLATAPLAGAASEVRMHSLPGPVAFPESIGADPRTGAFFTGSLIDGTLYRGDLAAEEARVFLPAGSDGRTSVAGVKVDADSRIWVADAFNGRVLVYDERGALQHVFVLAGPGTPTVNDIAFTRGSAYVTDSARPFLYRISIDEAARPGTTTLQPWLDVSGSVVYSTGEGPFGVNLNGIVASPDGATLLTVQTNTGKLFRVDTATRVISPVEVVRDGDLLFGDGLLRVGDHLYVARNAANEIVKLTLGAGWTTVRVDRTVTNPAFAFPTALAELRGRLLVANSQLDAGNDPTLPFTVVDLPLP